MKWSPYAGRKPTGPKAQKVTVYLREDELQEWSRLAERGGQSLSSWIAETVSESILWRHKKEAGCSD